MIDAIICGAVPDALHSIPDETFQTCITSPPYWGLRDYGLDPAVWDGDPLCQHEWGANGSEFHKGQVPQTKWKDVDAVATGGNAKSGQFCHKCGAWLGCLGLEPTPELYVDHLVQIFREVKRVLRNDGTLWLNIGDSYWGGKGRSGYELPHEAAERNSKGETFQNGHNVPGYMDMRPSDGRHHIIKPKDMVLIPFRLALALQADGAADPKAMGLLMRIETALLKDYETWEEVPAYTKKEVELLASEYEQAQTGGWWIRSDIIWKKPNCMPSSVKDRPTTDFEHVFLLAKSKKYYYDQDAIREPQTGNTHPKGNKLTPPIEKAGIGHAEWAKRTNAYVEVPGGRNKRTVWTIPTAPYPEAHFATFPPALIEPMILAGSSDKACPQCGAAWTRVTKKVEFGRADTDSQLGDGIHERSGAKSLATKRQAYRAAGLESPPAPVTTGWKPLCNCEDNDGSGASVILDPFAGSGTTCAVAKAHGRHWIGIEANGEYCELARRRILDTHSQLKLNFGGNDDSRTSD